VSTFKTRDLGGVALNWAVGKAIGASDPLAKDWRPASQWEQGGPLIEKEGMTVEPIFRAKAPGTLNGIDRWYAKHPMNHGGLIRSTGSGPTPLVAAMRCLVCARLGDDIEIPSELESKLGLPKTTLEAPVELGSLQLGGNGRKARP
jgi:hypothetical protein